MKFAFKGKTAFAILFLDPYHNVSDVFDATMNISALKISINDKSSHLS